MREGTVYHCPVCTRPYKTEAEAIACRNKHGAMEKKWVYCEVCGRGFNIDNTGWGRQLGVQKALECEGSHDKKSYSNT